MTDQRVTWKYLLACTGAVFFTWIIHEFSHWITSESLGYESVLTLNSVSPLSGQKYSELHNVYVSVSGPLITILQAVIVFVFLLSRNWNKLVYPFLFTPLYMRLLAGWMNFINPNDEGRISEYFGLGVFTLSVLVNIFLFFLVYKISNKYKLGWKFNTWTTIIIMVVSSILILSDQILHVRIL
ncbi:hypothetical protein [Robertkochia solimangrovi]|uniref:hypothetical protein n=1 Tax=Robertkochia solimangrovi TaxID=2213046 RepID=UPI001180913D|nr:hypothetical protein [Robertkochia solimangrovi]TRZ41956.1 hypothetical protein DMZ48_15065 [Robertkochia solimangrovi]